MAGLFSLGSGGRGSNQQQEEEEAQGHHNPTTEFPPPETLYWYKNEDVSSYRGLELWRQQQEQFMSQTRPSEQDAYTSGVGASRSYEDPPSSSRSSGMMRGRGGISCQDCGNKAKKDCPHMRCRTCCKSRGFHCQTHIKSTWVPAPKRHERQQQHQHQHQLQLHPHPIPKRHREIEHRDFPAVVSSAADFRCVRVNSLDDVDEQYAYQTAVNIGGHVFRGILYDQGPDYSYTAGDEIATAGVSGVQPLNLIGGGTSVLPASTSVSGGAMVSSSGALVDPSSLYPAPLNTFMAGGSGTQFFPYSRSS